MNTGAQVVKCCVLFCQIEFNIIERVYVRLVQEKPDNIVWDEICTKHDFAHN